MLMTAVAFVACSDAEPEVVSEPAVTDAAPEIVVSEPAPVELRPLMFETGVELTFTECPSDDRDAFSPEDDPLGVLVCGEPYSVTYIPASGEWEVTGPKERPTPDGGTVVTATHTYPGASYENGAIGVWGGTYYFDDDRRVYSDRAKTVAVGRLASRGS